MTAVDTEAREAAVLAARIADDKKGTDPVVLMVGDVLAITDYFVITSASNSRLVRALAEEVEKALRERLGRRPLRTEGLRDLAWVLLDYGDIVVHVFNDESRRFYRLEHLYRDVPPVDWRSG